MQLCRQIGQDSKKKKKKSNRNIQSVCTRTQSAYTCHNPEAQSPCVWSSMFWPGLIEPFGHKSIHLSQQSHGNSAARLLGVSCPQSASIRGNCLGQPGGGTDYWGTIASDESSPQGPWDPVWTVYQVWVFLFQYPPEALLNLLLVQMPNSIQNQTVLSQDAEETGFL